MKLQNILLSSLSLFCAVLLFSCQPDNNNWEKTHKGKFSYKIIQPEKSATNQDTIGFGDLVTFHYVLKNGTQVVESSYLSGEAVELELPAKPGRNQFMEALTLARPGDSLLVKVKYDDALEDLSSYKEHFKSGDEATFGYKIIKVTRRADLLAVANLKYALSKGYNSVSEMEAERNYYKNAADSLYGVVKEQIGFKKLGKLALEKNAEGLQWHLSAKAEGGSPIEAGDTVFVFYMGLVEKDARIFDDIFLKKGDRLVFTVADSSFNAPMLHKSVQLLQKGSKATIFVPSKLGYGTAGSGKSVPPNADLVLYIDVVEVRPKQ